MIFMAWHLSCSKLYSLIVWPGLSFVCEIGSARKRRSSLTAEMAVTSAFESADEGLCIFEICCDDLDALG
jgi:hypothetical protein